MLEECFCSLVINTSSDYLYKAPIPHSVSLHKCWGHWNFPGTNNHPRSKANPGHRHHNGAAVGSKGCEQRCQEDPLPYSFTFQAAACTNPEQFSNTATETTYRSTSTTSELSFTLQGPIPALGVHLRKGWKPLQQLRRELVRASSKEVYSQIVDVLGALHGSPALSVDYWSWQSGQQGEFPQNFRRVSMLKRDNS